MLDGQVRLYCTDGPDGANKLHTSVSGSKRLYWPEKLLGVEIITESEEL